MALSPWQHIGLAILCSLALLTDVIDGWCYRKFVKTPYQHWFNHLPISMDPIADFAFVMGGVLYCHESLKTGIISCAVLAIFTSICNLLMVIGSDRVYKIFATFLTYSWFLIMVSVLIGAWMCSAEQYWQAGVIATLVIFYSIWFKTRQKSRTIRKRR